MWRKTTARLTATASHMMMLGARPAGLRLATLLALLVGLMAGQLMVLAQEQLSSNLVEARSQKVAEDLDTLKYLEKLEKLDKYWSEVARPRFGRSEYKQPSANRQRQAPFELGRREQAFEAAPVAELLLQAALSQRQRQLAAESYSRGWPSSGQ